VTTGEVLSRHQKHHGIVDGKVNVFAWWETEKYWNERIGIATAMEK